MATTTTPATSEAELTPELLERRRSCHQKAAIS